MQRKVASFPSYTDLSGKGIIVTGSASNIGRAIVHAFALSCDAPKLCIADIDVVQGEKVKGEIERLNPHAQVLFRKCNVIDEEEVKSMVEEVCKQFGTVDVLVNNVGWVIDRLFIDKPRSEWKKEIDLNLWSVINCISAVLPIMIKQKGGSIVSVGSEAGRVGEFREAVYSSCKAGVIALSKALSRENGKFGIRFNVVCPSLTVPEEDEIGSSSMWVTQRKIFTPEIISKASQNYPLRRLGTPRDVANSVLFFASSGSNFITGQTLGVSGGYCML